MTTLADIKRLKGVVVTPRPGSSSSVATTDKVILPLSLVRALETHELVQVSGVDIDALHGCMVVMFSSEKNESIVDPDDTCPRYTPPTLCVNADCGERDVRETRDGDWVCNSCGVVQGRVCHTQFSKTETAAHAKRPAHKLPKWTEHCLETDGYYHEHTRELEHWNHYVNLSDADMSRAKWYIRKSLRDQRVSPLVRVVAALLAPRFLDTVDMEDVRQRVLKRTKLVIPSFDPPAAEFACPRCHAKVATLCDARRHPCNWGKHKRKRVSL